MKNILVKNHLKIRKFGQKLLENEIVLVKSHLKKKKSLRVLVQTSPEKMENSKKQDNYSAKKHMGRSNTKHFIDQCNGLHK